MGISMDITQRNSLASGIAACYRAAASTEALTDVSAIEHDRR